MERSANKPINNSQKSKKDSQKPHQKAWASILYIRLLVPAPLIAKVTKIQFIF